MDLKREIWSEKEVSENGNRKCANLQAELLIFCKFLLKVYCKNIVNINSIFIAQDILSVCDNCRKGMSGDTLGRKKHNTSTN